MQPESTLWWAMSAWGLVTQSLVHAGGWLSGSYMRQLMLAVGWWQTRRKLLGFYRTEGGFGPDFADIKHDYTNYLYTGVLPVLLIFYQQMSEDRIALRCLSWECNFYPGFWCWFFLRKHEDILAISIVSGNCNRGLVMPYDEKRFGSILAQVMACCLTAPSHYLNPLAGFSAEPSPVGNLTNIGSDNGLSPSGAKPLSKPMLEYCQLEP